MELGDSAVPVPISTQLDEPERRVGVGQAGIEPQRLARVYLRLGVGLARVREGKEGQERLGVGDSGMGERQAAIEGERF